MSLYVGTCNVRHRLSDVGTSHFWKLRRKRLANLLRHIACDVWALQETSQPWIDYLNSEMTEYTFLKSGANSIAIAYRNNLPVSDQRIYNTRPGRSIPLIQTGGTWIGSIHNTYNIAPARALEKASETALARTNRPLLLIGDWNEPDPQIDGMLNARDTLAGAGENVNSYHGWRRQPENGRWIDHALYTPDLAVSDLALIRTSIGATRLWETDHNILTCRIG